MSDGRRFCTKDPKDRGVGQAATSLVQLFGDTMRYFLAKIASILLPQLDGIRHRNFEREY